MSQVSLFLTCGLSYFLQRTLKLPQRQAPWFFQGNAVHAGVEAWERSWRKLPPEQVVTIYEETWEREETRARETEPNLEAWQRSGVKKVENDIRDRRVRGREQLLTYMENTVKERLRPWILPDTHEPATEVPFEESFGGVTVKGYIDLILEDPHTHQLVVRDVKTGAKQPKGWFQLATYRLAIQKKYGVTPQWGDYWMCKDDGPSSPVYLGEVSPVLIESQFQTVDDGINRERFGANIGEHCDRCSVSRFCPFVGGEAPEGVHFLGT